MNSFYQNIELTPEEIEAALLEGKKRKFFHLRAVAYWEEQKQNGIANHEEKKRVKREKYAQTKALKQRAISYESRAQTHQEDLSSSK